MKGRRIHKQIKTKHSMTDLVQYDEKTGKAFYVRQNDDGSIFCSPITTEEAAQWYAENRF